MNRIFPLIRKNIYGLLSLIILAGMLFIGLWPLDFNPRNEVEWLKDRTGLRFYGRGIVYSSQPSVLSPQSSLFIPRSFTLELCLQPKIEPSQSLPCILSFCNEDQSENFFLGQWRSSLIIRKRTTPQGSSRGYKEIGLREALLSEQIQFITITSGERGASIYLNGEFQKSYPNFLLLPSPATTLVLGNSSNGKSPWTGNLLGLALYDRLLTADEIFRHAKNWQEGDAASLAGEKGLLSLYLFGEGSGTAAIDSSGSSHLSIPPSFRPVRKEVLTSPREDFSWKPSYFKDVIVNILGFIPFGFFLFAWVKPKTRSVYAALLTTLLVASAASLAIELIQAYLPTRSSQLTDLITNTLGGFFGAILFHLGHPKTQRS